MIALMVGFDYTHAHTHACMRTRKHTRTRTCTHVRRHASVQLRLGLSALSALDRPTKGDDVELL